MNKTLQIVGCWKQCAGKWYVCCACMLYDYIAAEECQDSAGGTIRVGVEYVDNNLCFNSDINSNF